PTTDDHAADRQSWRMPELTYPQDNPFSEAKYELGRMLFFDPRINREAVSCARCHHPGMNWANNQARTLINGKVLPRHTPSLINVAYNRSFFWDGRAKTLEECIAQHFGGMDMPDMADDTVTRVRLIQGYEPWFQKAFGARGINAQTIAQSLATFVRGIIVNDSPFDRWVAGDDEALSSSAKRGFALFTGKAGCVKCHTPPHFSDFSYHRTGTNSIDPGRYEITGREEDRNAFRTPQLRQIAETAPYMHTGQKATLADVIHFYESAGDVRSRGQELRAFKLDERETKDLIAFLKSLSGTPVRAEIPILPALRTH
ncbi:MAG: hypothetical protein D6703_07475, partial [Zetaproteobacteria bacterium]